MNALPQHPSFVILTRSTRMSSITPASSVGAVYQGAERRMAERSVVDLQAILRFPDRLQAIQGKVCDLSVGGAGFICLQGVAAHSRCTLQFILPSVNQSSGPMLSVAAVVLCSMKTIGQANHVRVNLQFAEITAHVRGQIEAYVRRSLG
jgi:hypothetical protein